MNTNNLRGAFYVIAAMQFFVLNDAFVKSLSGLLEWHQALTLRGLFATIFLLLVGRWLDGPRSLPEMLGYIRDRHVLARAGFEVMATSFWVIALMHMTLNGVVAVNQLIPVFLMLGGALIYKEYIGAHRLGAAMVSFLGVLLVVRPGTDSFSIYALYALLATAMMAARDVVTRALKPSLPSTYVALIGTCMITLCAFMVSLWSDWPALDGPILGRSAGAGVSLGLAYLTMIRGVREGEVSFLAPFRYSTLLGGILMAYFWFGERPDVLSLAGAVIIASAGLYILARERRARRRAAV